MATVQVLPCYNRHGYSVSLLLNGVRQLDAHTFCNDECLSLTDIRVKCRQTAVEMAQESGLTSKDFDLYREPDES